MKWGPGHGEMLGALGGGSALWAAWALQQQLQPVQGPHWQLLSGCGPGMDTPACSTLRPPRGPSLGHKPGI